MRPPAKGRGATLVALVASVALVAGCSSSSSPGGSTGDPGVLTGPGVTETTITIGELTDLTGVYATLGKSLTQAQELYFEQVNAAGGVCGRKIELLVRDHGYDEKKGVVAYAEIAPQVVGISQLLGSQVLTAVLPSLNFDGLLAIPAAWPSSMLKEKYVQIVGTTYDIEMMNGVDFLMKEKGLVKGDKIGHIYFEGGYGENGLLGSKFAAQQAGLTLIEKRIKATDSDMTAQVAALKSAGVKAILMSAGPKQTASAAGVAAVTGLKVPIVSNNPGFSPQLLDTPAGPAIEKSLYIVNSVQTPSATITGIQNLVTAYEAKFPGAPVDNAVAFGYVTAKVFGDALRIACDAKNLTRQGVVDAVHTITSFDTEGVMAPLDFSRIGDVGTRESYIQTPNRQAKGGLVTIAGPAPSEASLRYQFPG